MTWMEEKEASRQHLINFRAQAHVLGNLVGIQRAGCQERNQKVAR